MSTDAIVLLKQEHKELLRLIREYRAADAADLDTRSELVEQIVHDLTVQSYLADEVLYPQVSALLRDPTHEVLRGYQDHRLTDRLTEEVAGRSPADPGFDAGVEALIDAVTRHIDHEEREWFPLLRAAVGRKELQEIGTRLLAVRETAPRHRPGPVSGATPGAPG